MASIERLGAACLVLGLGVALANACGGGGGSDTSTPSGVHIDPVNGKYDVFVDPAEPRVLRFQTSDGRTLTVFAEKNDTGEATRITGLFVQDAAQLASGVGRLVEIDANDRVARITGADGAVLDLVWTTDTACVVNATSASGAAQVNVPVDLSADDASASSSSSSFVQSPLTTSATGTVASAATQYGLVTIAVRRCGGDVQPGEVVGASVVAESQVPTLVYPAQARSGGSGFVARVPLGSSNAAAPIDVDKVCASIGRIGARACKDSRYATRLKKLLCGKLLPILQAAAPDPADLKSVEDACDVGLLGLALYCAALEGDPATAICADVKGALQSALGGNTSTVVRARALIRGAGVKASANTVTLDASTVGTTPPRLVVDYGGDTRILGAETAPADPAPYQDYVIKVRVLCAAGKKVTISVVGSDKYTQTKTYSPTDASAELEMSVPGGAGSVKDTITIALDGKTAKTVTIVF